MVCNVVKPNESSKWAWKSKKTTDRPNSNVQTCSKDENYSFEKL